MPGKSTICKKCGEQLNKTHSIKCNFIEWGNEILNVCKDWEIKSALFEINGFFSSSAMWPMNIIKAITKISRNKFKVLLIESLANTLKSCMIKCAWEFK